MDCPVCNVPMEELVEGIFQCPKCKKLIKEKKEELEIKEDRESEQGIILDREYFHNNLSLNEKYEICEKGIIVKKTETRLFAVLICHSPYTPDNKYLRLSWWKNQTHAGMFKIFETSVLSNLIKSLKKIEKNFNDFWTFEGRLGSDDPKSEKQKSREREREIIKYRILENQTCPSCQRKMNKEKSHYECPHCGEIVILEEYNQPIFNIPPENLNLDFHTNFPINYYLPVSGITIKSYMGEWKAIVVIYSRDNPNKKWLRFYWWVRDLQNIVKYGRSMRSENGHMGWNTKKGMSSPNIYDKSVINPLIITLEKLKKELNWNKIEEDKNNV